jgi:peptidoglycan/xylan/chitin deacetylase (PgdA/CDA1 family)
VPYGVDLYHCTLNGMVALTFDDGPYIYTTSLLDVLARNSVKATFFVVGDNGGKGQIQDPSTGYPAIIRRMVADGHQVGSHTWGHQDLATLTAQQRRDQIILNEIALVEILGYFPTYMRPPYTSWNAESLVELGNLGYHVVSQCSVFSQSCVARTNTRPLSVQLRHRYPGLGWRLLLRPERLHLHSLAEQSGIVLLDITRT